MRLLLFEIRQFAIGGDMIDRISVGNNCGK